jgi:hypothetical protein
MINKGDTVFFKGKKAKAIELHEDGGQVLIELENKGREWVNFDWLDGKEG